MKAMPVVRLCAAVMASLLAGCAAQGFGRAGEEGQILKIAAAREPKIAWDEESVVAADLDCDGREDYAIGGREGEDYVVMAILGPPSSRSAVSVLVFDGAELCGKAVALSAESLDYDPAEAGDLPGFQPSKTCKGLNVNSGECDAFHIFWNHEDKELDWWRL
jgi:hypothetical protein